MSAITRLAGRLEGYSDAEGLPTSERTDLRTAAACLRGKAQTEQQPAAIPTAIQTIIDKGRRFIETTEDDCSFDIGRDWADALTKLGLLVRVQRSPAMWATTTALHDLIDWAEVAAPETEQRRRDREYEEASARG